MYAAIRRWRVEPDSAAEVARLVNEDFVSAISELPGFIAYYVVDAGDGVMVSFSLFNRQAEAEDSNSVAVDWVRRNLGPLITDVAEVTAGEVVAHQAT